MSSITSTNLVKGISLYISFEISSYLVSSILGLSWVLGASVGLFLALGFSYVFFGNVLGFS